MLFRSVTVAQMIGHYKRSKFLAEQAVRARARERGLAVVTVNPSTPIGPGDIKPTPTGRILLDAAAGRMPAFVDTGLNLVHVDDCAQGHLLAFASGVPGGRYILGGDDFPFLLRNADHHGGAEEALQRHLVQEGRALHHVRRRPEVRLPDAEVDHPVALRRQMTTFQGILTRELQQSFEQPFGLLQDVKGMYLSRYGVAFHMEVNLVPLRMLTMFDYRPYSEEELRATRDAKLARIQQLKAKLGDLLMANVQELAAVPQEQQIAVVVHLFNLPSERVEGLPSQVVVEVKIGRAHV